MKRTMGSAYMEWAKTHPHGEIDLAASGMPDVRLADLPVSLADLELTTPGAYGYPPLLERIGRRFGVGPDCVVEAAGASMANMLAMDSLIDPGDHVLIEDPTYELLVSAAEHLGAVVHRFPRRAERDFAVDPDAIAAALTPATRLIVLTNLHNPSSALCEEPVLREVGALATRAGARVLVDEVYLDTLYDHRPWRSSVHLGPAFVATGSLTKAFGLSGLRCGWILAAPDLAHRMWRLNDLFLNNAAHPVQRLAIAAFDHLDRFAVRARDQLQANRTLLHRFLDGRPDLSCHRAAFGTVAFPRLARGDGDRLCRLLLDTYRTTAVPGRFFGAPDHIRIGIVRPTEMVAEGLRRLGQALDDIA